MVYKLGIVRASHPDYTADFEKKNLVVGELSKGGRSRNLTTSGV
jgi:hypothetical protein